MKTTEFLDAAKNRLNIESDYALAKHLGVTKQTVSRYRNGLKNPDSYACARLADAIGINAIEIIAAIEAETEKDADRRAYWESKQKGTRANGGRYWDRTSDPCRVKAVLYR